MDKKLRDHLAALIEISGCPPDNGALLKELTGIVDAHYSQVITGLWNRITDLSEAARAVTAIHECSCGHTERLDDVLDQIPAEASPAPDTATEGGI